MTGPELTHEIIGAAIEVHRQLGPGLLESAYEECMAKEFTLPSISFDRQKPLPVVYKGLRLNDEQNKTDPRGAEGEEKLKCPTAEFES